jgi:hypothetical protein
LSWDKKGKQRFFYASIREGDRVRKRYFGRGQRAERAAKELLERQEARQRERDALREQLALTAHADNLLQDLQKLADDIVQATLLGAGCYSHHGQWRRGHKARRATNDSNRVNDRSDRRAPSIAAG